MCPPSEVGAAVVWHASHRATHEDADQQVVDRWAAGDSPAVIASEVRILLEDVEGILLAALFDFR